jgi:hypothetical protein
MKTRLWLTPAHAGGTCVLLALLALGMVAAAVAGGAVAGPGKLAAGGGAAASANYSVQALVGQPAAGLSASANYGLCSGAWCPPAAPGQSKLFLPLVRR